MSLLNNLDQSSIIAENSNTEKQSGLHREILPPSQGFLLANFPSCGCKKRSFATTFVSTILGKNIEVFALVDTGSCNTLINIKIWRKIIKDDDISKTISESFLRFKSSNGNALSCVGQANIRFKIGDIETIHACYIIDGNCHSFIMGCDLISKLKATIDFANEEIVIQNKKYPLRSVITHQKPHDSTEEHLDSFF